MSTQSWFIIIAVIISLIGIISFIRLSIKASQERKNSPPMINKNPRRPTGLEWLGITEVHIRKRKENRIK